MKTCRLLFAFILIFSIIQLPLSSINVPKVLAPPSKAEAQLPDTLEELFELWVENPRRLPGEYFQTDFTRPVTIAALGVMYPSRVVTNKDLVVLADTAIADTRRRLENSPKPFDPAKLFTEQARIKFEKKGTGITVRRWFDPETDVPSKMAAEAIREALAQIGLTPEQISPNLLPYMIGIASYGAEVISPGLGPLVNQHLGINFPFPSLSAEAVCPGWIAGLHAMLPHVAARNLVHLGLLPVAEYYSKYLRPDSGSSWPIFGDMTAGTVLTPAKTGYGILWASYQTDGKKQFIKQEARGKPIGEVVLADIIQTRHGEFFGMHGQAVGVVASLSGYFALKRLERIIQWQGIKAIKDERLKEADGLKDVDWFVFHQANRGLVLKLADKLGIPHEKCLFTIEKFANTSAASIPLTLYEHRDKIEEGQLVFMGTFGGGFQWGGILSRWGGADLNFDKLTSPLVASLAPPDPIVEQAI